MTAAQAMRNGMARYAANPSHVGLGRSVGPRNYCPVTAVITYGEDPDAGWRAMELFREVVGSPAVSYNARHTTREVLDAMERTAAVAEERGL